MIRSWLAAALGTLFLAGSSTGASLPNNDQRPHQPAAARQALAVDTACVGAAVHAREEALTLASAAQTQTVAAAYAARAAALDTAYTSTDLSSVRNSVRTAWDTFATVTKNAKKTWQSGRENAWKTFRNAIKSCKGAESVSDASSAPLEQQGD